MLILGLVVESLRIECVHLSLVGGFITYKLPLPKSSRSSAAATCGGYRLSCFLDKKPLTTSYFIKLGPKLKPDIFTFLSKTLSRCGVIKMLPFL